MKTRTASSSTILISLPFFVMGFLSLGLAIITLLRYPDMLFGHYYKPALLAWTHLLVLGWLMSMVVGALYQLAPVISAGLLWSRPLAGLHLIIHAIAVPGMVLSFRTMNFYAIGHWGSVVVLGLILFITNILVTLVRSRRRTLPAVGIALALVWLLVMMSVVLYALAAKYLPIDGHPPFRLLQLHAHLGFGGFFLLLLMSVTYKLVPLFTLSPEPNHLRGWLSIGLLNGALVFFFLAMWYERLSWLPYVAGVAGIAVILFLIEVFVMIDHRKRKLDWGLRLFLVSLLCLLPVICGIIWQTLIVTGRETVGLISIPSAYLLIYILGVLSLAIMGMATRIIPFLIWQWKYSALLGRQPVPMIHELGSPIYQFIGMLFFVPAVCTLATGMMVVSSTVVYWGAGLYLAGYIMMLVNGGFIARHAFTPTRGAVPVSTSIPTTNPALSR